MNYVLVFFWTYYINRFYHSLKFDVIIKAPKKFFIKKFLEFLHWLYIRAIYLYVYFINSSHFRVKSKMYLIQWIYVSFYPKIKIYRPRFVLAYGLPLHHETLEIVFLYSITYNSKLLPQIDYPLRTIRLQTPALRTRGLQRARCLLVLTSVRSWPPSANEFTNTKNLIWKVQNKTD